MILGVMNNTTHSDNNATQIKIYGPEENFRIYA